MSRLRAAAEEYLAMRRALGFKLTVFGPRLMGFVGYCEARNVDHVRTDLALEWATATPGSSDGVYQARRLDVVRIFARHRAPMDPATEVPGQDLLPHRYRRVAPHHYGAEEITALMDVADSLVPATRAATWRTLIGLLAVTGMRVGEACRLRRGDVAQIEGRIVILDSKFNKSRQVFCDPTTVVALDAYAQARDQRFRGPGADTFFVNSRGTSLDPSNLPHTFAKLVTTTGITAPAGRRAPRLHDLRHTFAIDTMLAWYRDGGDVQARLPLLSTWLGHVDPKSTYWYLQAVPELLALAAARLEQADQDPEAAP